VVEPSRGLALEARRWKGWRHRGFDLFHGGERFATVRTSLLRGIRTDFAWDLPGPHALAVQGDFYASHYRFVRGSRTVALVSTLAECDGALSIEVRPCEERAIIVFSAVVIRCLCDEPHPANAGRDDPMNPTSGRSVPAGLHAVG